MADKAPADTGRKEMLKRLDGYWRLEAGNVVLVPGTMVFVAAVLGGRVGWLSLLPLAAMMLLLVIGAAYWRAKLHRMQWGRSMASALRWIAALQWPSLGLSLVAALIATLGWLMPHLSAGLADRIVASIAALLAVLEYVNYYYRQVQHFDRPSDWRRLKSGKGFRASQMRQDLDRMRAGADV